MNVFNIAKVPHEQLVSSKTGEIFSKSAVLTEILSCQKVFVHHEILSTGRRASSPHSHTIMEEIIFVLKGYPTAILGNQTAPLKPGDFLKFDPGVQEHHYIENTSGEEAHFLVICSNKENDQVIFNC